MKKFRATVPIYKTITGEIAYTFEAEDIEQAHDIFEKAFKNGEVHSQAFETKDEDLNEEGYYDYDDRAIEEIKNEKT